MNVAVIGSNSLLASYLIDELTLKGNHFLYLFGRKDTNRPNTKFTHFSYPETELEFAAILTCDAVIYCAAAGVQANTQTNVSLTYEVNAFLPIRLINYLSDNKFTGIWVSFGSYFEIGNNNVEHSYTEVEVITSNLKIPNHYCSSKRLLTRFMSNGVSNVRMLHFILPTIYGSRENLTRLIPFIVDALKNNKTVQLSAGEQIRQYIHCQDVASLVHLAIGSDCESGVYNVATEAPVKIRDLVIQVFQLFDSDPSDSLGKLSTRDESMKFLALNTQKINSQFPRWIASMSLQEGIANYL